MSVVPEGVPAEAPIAASVIGDCLRDHYAVTVVGLELLAGGLDRRAWTYRVDCEGGSPLVLRLTSAESRPATYAVPRSLCDLGISAVVGPIPAIVDELVVRRHGLVWSVYPFIDGADGWHRGLTEQQWTELGATLRAVHETALSPTLRGIVCRDAFAVAAYAEATSRSDAFACEPTRGAAPPAFVRTWRRHHRDDYGDARADGAAG